MPTQPENKDKAEQRISKDELTDKQLDKAAGGVEFTYGSGLQVQYVAQTSSGTVDTTKTK